MVDCGTDYNMAPEAVESALSPRTKAVIPVDIGGFPCDYSTILDIIKKASFSPSTGVQENLGRPLLLIDAAHSLGASYRQKSVGCFGDIIGFSFHAVKNLTTAEGGALVLNVDGGEELKQWMSIMSLHGQTKSAMDKTTTGKWEYDVIEPGYKCNMTDIQAAMGLVELNRYTETLERRKAICRRYSQAFEGNSLLQIPLQQDNNRETSYHLYMLRFPSATRDQRDEMMNRIHDSGVSVNVHFKPLVELTAYRDWGDKKDFPTAFDQFEKEISLPVYFDLNDEQVDKVIVAVSNAAREVLG
jgi:dTDP-4-amino-4,6-dideoxygalactose transaminase